MSLPQLDFSTYDVHPRDRFSLWHDAACRSFVQHECSPDNRTTFDAEVLSAPLGPLLLVTCANSPMRVRRTDSQACQDVSDDIFFLLQRSGSCLVAQDGRNATITTGDFCILDPTRVYDIRYPKFSSQLVLKVPRGHLEARLGKSAAFTSLRIASESGVGALASGFIRMLPMHMAGLEDDAKVQLAHHTLDLIALAFTSVATGDPPKLSSSGSSATLLRVKQAVEASLAIKGVRCDDIAARARVSARYANQLLAPEGTSLERLLQERRLAKCREALGAPTHTKRSISQIAYSWGFSDPSHFARTFRAAFGVSPTAYRQQRA